MIENPKVGQPVVAFYSHIRQWLGTVLISGPEMSTVRSDDKSTPLLFPHTSLYDAAGLTAKIAELTAVRDELARLEQEGA